MLIDRLFTDPFKRLVGLVQRVACPRLFERQAEAAAAARAELEAGAWENDSHSTQRINLARTLPTTCSLLLRFFRKLTVQEPTLQEVVVVYTEIAGASRDDGYDGGSSHVPGSLHVRLKSFRDIPCADVEVVLPGLRASGLKSADVVKIVIYVVGGIATAVYGFAYGTSSRWLLTATLLSLLAIRAWQTWASVNNAKHTMNEFIRTTLYHRSQDSQRGVLLSVLNSIAQHELREALTIYLLMRAHGLRRVASASADMSPRADGTIAPRATRESEEPPEVASSSSLVGAALSGLWSSNPSRGASSTSSAVEAASSDEAGFGALSVAEAEQVTSDFLESEFGVLVHVRADEALERLRRLGLVRREIPPSPTSDLSPKLEANGVERAAAERAAARRKPAALPLDYESHTAVPVSEALGILRRVWGAGGRGVAKDAAHKATAPSLMGLTAPITPSGGRHRSLSEHSPITPFPKHSYAPRDLSM